MSRDPRYYEECGVPDTIDGHFDMLVWHVALVMKRFQSEGQWGEDASQVLFDVMFVNIDRNLREAGIGDLGVPRHMRRMMKGFNGRALHYRDALENNDMSALDDSVRRNIFGTVDHPDKEHVGLLMKEMKDFDGALLKMSLEKIWNLSADNRAENLKDSVSA